MTLINFISNMNLFDVLTLWGAFGFGCSLGKIVGIAINKLAR